MVDPPVLRLHALQPDRELLAAEPTPQDLLQLEEEEEEEERNVTG